MQANQYVQSPKNKVLPSLNQSMMMPKKKDRSINSVERDYSEHFYDGSTGMNIGVVGMKTSPRAMNPLAKAIEVIGGSSIQHEPDSYFH